MTTLGTQERPLKVAVVGAGPAGFFAAAALLKNKAGVDVRVDLFDRLPAPYGLVRYGVAPDHAKIKSVSKVYERTALDERVRFFGDVEFGRDLKLADLRERYDQIVFTVGAQSDRPLGIAGEDLEGSHSATEFVAWYNGHPDYADHTFGLGARAAVVVGAGNVALDVARILAKSVEELHPTDIAQHALDALRGSLIEDVYVIARRGPAQAKFSKKELREFGELEVAHAVTVPTTGGEAYLMGLHEIVPRIAAPIREWFVAPHTISVAPSSSATSQVVSTIRPDATRSAISTSSCAREDRVTSSLANASRASSASMSSGVSMSSLQPSVRPSDSTWSSTILASPSCDLASVSAASYARSAASEKSVGTRIVWTFMCGSPGAFFARGGVLGTSRRTPCASMLARVAWSRARSHISHAPCQHGSRAPPSYLRLVGGSELANNG